MDFGTDWNVIMVAALSNIAFKGAIVAVLGSRALFARVALLSGISLVADLFIFWLWPESFVLDWFGNQSEI